MEIINDTSKLEPVTAEDIAEFLGLTKHPVGSAHKFNVEAGGAFITIIRQMILGHEKSKKERQAIVTPNIVLDPFTKG